MKSRDIVFDLSLNAPLSQVWSAWTNSRKLERWLTVKANVRAEVGGPYELFWQPETPDQNSTKGCTVSAALSEKLLSFNWKGPVPYADLMNVDPTPTWVVVTFESISEAETVVHFRHSGWGDTPRWSEARQWQENAWRGAFVELAKLFP